MKYFNLTKHWAPCLIYNIQTDRSTPTEFSVNFHSVSAYISSMLGWKIRLTNPIDGDLKG